MFCTQRAPHSGSHTGALCPSPPCHAFAAPCLCVNSKRTILKNPAFHDLTSLYHNGSAAPPKSPFLSHAPVATLLRAFSEQPWFCSIAGADFLLLRVRVVKVDRGESGSNDLVVRCREWSDTNIATFMWRFGCIANFVDHDILALNSVPYPRRANSGATSRSPPGKVGCAICVWRKQRPSTSDEPLWVVPLGGS